MHVYFTLFVGKRGYAISLVICLDSVHGYIDVRLSQGESALT